MTSAPAYEIKTPAAVLAEDVICQSFIQSSSTLAYACLALRRGRHDLAAHVLHSLEAKPASRFKDMVFYLQCQIGIETGDFEAVKRRLVPRAHQHPNDMVALSLLESCVFLEWEEYQRRNPGATDDDHAARTLAEERPEPAPSAAAAPAEPASPWAGASADPVPASPSGEPYLTRSVRQVPPSGPGAPEPEPAPFDLGREFAEAPAFAAAAGIDLPEAPAAPAPAFPPATDSTGSFQALSPAAVEPARPAARPAPATEPPAREAAAAKEAGAAKDAAYAPASAEGDFGIYQALVADPNTQALTLWNAAQRRLRSTSRRPDLEPLVGTLPQLLPQGLADAVQDLEGGEIHKVCFSFQALTLTSLHAGPENLGLVTGNLNQSLLTMVRAENIFAKQGGAAGARGAARPAAGTADVDPRAARQGVAP